VGTGAHSIGCNQLLQARAIAHRGGLKDVQLFYVRDQEIANQRLLRVHSEHDRRNSLRITRLSKCRLRLYSLGNLRSFSLSDEIEEMLAHAASIALLFYRLKCHPAFEGETGSYL